MTTINDFYTATEVREWFSNASTITDKDKRAKALYTGLVVKSKVRMELIGNGQQGKITLSGKVHTFTSINLGGGLWRMQIIL